MQLRRLSVVLLQGQRPTVAIAPHLDRPHHRHAAQERAQRDAHAPLQHRIFNPHLHSSSKQKQSLGGWGRWGGLRHCNTLPSSLHAPVHTDSLLVQNALACDSEQVCH